ncbi:MAG: LPS assembly lipoprotein LptE [Chromatocurvus sp.]
MVRSRLGFWVLLLLLSGLVGCGFQLRGSDGGSALPDQWQSMHLNTPSPNSELSRVLRTRFTASGIRWLPASEAAYTLDLGQERFSQRNLSINAQARAAEFELALRATFSVRGSDGELLLPPDDAIITKQMENDPRNVVGKAEEIRILRGEMRVGLAQQIMRRIAFFAASER